MNTNVRTLKIEKSGDDSFSIRMTCNQDDEYPSFLVITRDDYKLFKNRALGIKSPNLIIDDCTYLIKVGIDGMRVSYTDKRESDYYTFPICKLIPYTDYLMTLDHSIRLTIDLSYEVYEWGKEFSPKVKVIPADGVADKMSEDGKRKDIINLPIDLIDRLTRIAESYSNGNEIQVHISFDSTPCDDIPASYYWYIVNPENNQQCMNGGYIAHSNRGNPPQYEYSIHT